MDRTKIDLRGRAAADDAQGPLTEFLIVRHESLIQTVDLDEGDGDTPASAAAPADWTALAACLKRMERVRRATAEWDDAIDGVPTSENGMAADSDTPSRIGRFEILGELGRGGLGVVLLADDPVLKRRVALKIPRPEAVLTGELRKRFRREGQAAARLLHPHIVPVYEVGEVGPVCYIAAAFIEGENLAQWLARRTSPCGSRTAAALIADLAEAMQHAHARGVLHRDLKPSNILLERGAHDAVAGDDVLGVAKIADFGLAKVLDAGEDETRHGAVLGTPAYMAPEQAQGDRGAIGPLSDVYSLGAILYELLTGRAPFEATSEADMLARLLTDVPTAPRRLVADISRDLEAICLRCVEKKPLRRYGSAGELAADLRRFLAGTPTQARPLSPPQQLVKWSGRRPAQAALLAVSVAALLTVVAGTAIYSRNLNEALDAEKAQGRRAEDNLQLATQRQAQLNERLYASQMQQADQAIHQGDTGRARQLLAPYAPDQPLGHLRGIEWHVLMSEFRRIENTGKDCTTVVLEHSSQMYAALFMPDSDLVVAGGQDGRLRIWDWTAKRLLYNVAGHQSCINDLCFSKDGVHLFTASCDRSILKWELAETGIPLIVKRIPLEKAGRQIAISPDGTFLACVNGDESRTPQLQVWETTSWQQVYSDPLSGEQGLEWSADGRYLLHGHNNQLVIVRASGWREIVRKLHGGLVRVLFNPFGTAMALEWGRGLWQYDLESGIETLEFETVHPGPLAWNATTGSLAIGDGVAMFHVYDHRNAYRQRSFRQHHKARCADAAFSPDRSHLVTAGFDGRVCVTELEPRLRILPHVSHVFPSDQSRAVCGIDEDLQFATILNLNRNLLDRLKIDWTQAATNRCGDIGDTTARVTTGTEQFKQDLSPLGYGAEALNGKLVLRNLRDDTTVSLPVEVPPDTRWTKVFGSPSLVALLGEKVCAIVDVASQRVVQKIALPREFFWLIRSGLVDVAPDRGLVVLAEDDITLRLVNLSDGASRTLRVNAGGGHSCLTFSPNGQRIAMACRGDTVHIWDTEETDPIRDIRVNAKILALAFSPDSRTLAISTERELQFWHLETNQCMAAVPLHLGSEVLRYSADGRAFCCASTRRASADFYRWTLDDSATPAPSGK